MHDVIAVEALSDFRLLLTFDDGQQREVDVSELTPFDGVFAPLRDPAFFRTVRVNPDLGTIVWPNGTDLWPDVLYQRGRPRAVA